jgi:cytochrome P450
MHKFTIDRYAGAADMLRQRDLRQALYDEGAVIMDRVLVNLHGDEHKARRNLESKVFRRDFFKFYETTVFPATLAETLTPFLAAGRMDLVDFGYRVMVNLTADFTGIDRPGRSPRETEALVATLRIFGRAATLAHYKDDRDAVRRETLATLARFDRDYFTPSVERRRLLLEQFAAGAIDEAALPRDVLTVLLRNEDGIDLQRDVTLREIAFFALAGAHTSIHTLSHAMHELFAWCALHVQDRARIEADPLFVQRCVHESIRLHPSSPVAARRALCPVALPDERNAATGDEVTIDLQTANRDPAAFGDDAAQFNPHRALQKGQSPYGLSFGLGMHACLGLNLAAGVLPKPDTDPAQHHYGTVAMIVRALLAQRVRPDPADAPTKDSTTLRDLWGRYPVLLE